MDFIKLFLSIAMLILSCSSIAIAQEDHRDHHHANGGSVRLDMQTGVACDQHCFNIDRNPRSLSFDKFIQRARHAGGARRARWGRRWASSRRRWIGSPR